MMLKDKLKRGSKKLAPKKLPMPPRIRMPPPKKAMKAGRKR
jgi:hypothetical protein